jgi:hypothetical protein
MMLFGKKLVVFYKFWKVFLRRLEAEYRSQNSGIFLNLIGLSAGSR